MKSQLDEKIPTYILKWHVHAISVIYRKPLQYQSLAH